MRTSWQRWSGLAGAAVAVGLAAVLAAHPVRALDQQSGEQQAIDDCERRLCTLLQQKDAKGEDLKCLLSKTWGKAAIKEADQAKVKWGFGDARCTVQIHISRALIASALSSGGKEYKFWVPPHTANCLVEEGGVARPLTATLAPKIVFKNGKAEKIWVNLVSLEGPPTVKATLWAAAELTDNVGIFHGAMVKSVNRFIAKHCPSKYPLSGAGMR
jgi:hypothetical protein